MKVLLTSTGFSNNHFKELFIDNINKPIDQVKVLFVPTAAIDEDAIGMLPFCKKDLVDAGVLLEHIVTYNLDYCMNLNELSLFDAIYFCGGNEDYLIDRINKIYFAPILLAAISKGLFYIGVSAGSMIASASVENSLGLIQNELEPHTLEYTPCGPLPDGKIYLSDNQAIWITDYTKEIIK